MARAASRVYLGIHRPLTATILLLQVLSLVSLVQCYGGDVSGRRLSPQLVHDLAGVPALVAREKNPFSPPTFSRQRNKQDAGIGGILLTVAECKAEGCMLL